MTIAIDQVESPQRCGKSTIISLGSESLKW